MPVNGELERIAKEAVLKIRGKEVLDVGTGFGIVVNEVLTTTGCNLVSVDPEAWTFDRLKKKYETEISTGRLQLLREGIESLPFGSGRFDTSISISALHHFSDPANGIRSMEKVTRGMVIIADWKSTSAGVANPHSRKDLERSESRVMEFLKNNSYSTHEDKYWYMGWKEV